VTETNIEMHLLGLLERAGLVCRAKGQLLVLVVDGLDEDQGVMLPRFCGHFGACGYAAA